MPFHKSFGNALDRQVVPKKDLFAGMLRDAERRQRIDDRKLYDERGETVEVSINGTSGGASDDVTSNTALEVTVTIPAPSAPYALWVEGYVSNGSYSGTMTLTVAGVSYPGTFGSTGSHGVSANAIVSGGDTVVLRLIPVWSGGGTSSVGINFAATRAA